MISKPIALALICLLLMFTLSIALPTQVFAQVYPPGMVSYWKFDEGSGTTAGDSVGGNDGTIINPQWTEGVVNSCLYFSGSGSIEVAPAESLAVTGEFTIEAWFNKSDNSVQVLINKNHTYTVYLGPYNSIQVNLRKPGLGATIGFHPAEIIPGEWYHIAVAWDRHYLSVYLNGDLVDFHDYPTPYTEPTYLSIGEFNGYIDEVAIYNRTLTVVEILQHYNNGLKGLGYAQSWTGSATFGLENLYAVSLDANLGLWVGSKLVVKFYDYTNSYQGENVVWTGSTPDNVSFSKIVPHPEDIVVKKVRLDLTTDNTENVISTIATFTVTQDDLWKLIVLKKYMRWPFASPAEKDEMMKQSVDIYMQWPFVPSRPPAGAPATISLSRVEGIGFAGGIPTYSGIENIYIMQHGLFENTDNLCQHENLQVYEWNTAVIEDTGLPPENIPYENAFDIVVAVKGHTDNMAYVVKENMYVILVIRGAFKDDENTAITGKRYLFDNDATPTWIRVNHLFDNGGNGYTLKAGENIDLTVHYSLRT